MSAILARVVAERRTQPRQLQAARYEKIRAAD